MIDVAAAILTASYWMRTQGQITTDDMADTYRVFRQMVEQEKYDVEFKSSEIDGPLVERDEERG